MRKCKHCGTEVKEKRAKNVSGKIQFLPPTGPGERPIEIGIGEQADLGAGMYPGLFEPVLSCMCQATTEVYEPAHPKVRSEYYTTISFGPDSKESSYERDSASKAEAAWMEVCRKKPGTFFRRDRDRIDRRGKKRPAADNGWDGLADVDE
jgi:hypothetical protein